MANSNFGIRRVAKLYKTFSIKYPELLRFTKCDCNYCLKYQYPIKEFWITIFKHKILCSYYDSRGWWDSVIISSKEFYKVYQLIESWLRE